LLTKDRVGGALAITAAIVGLVLVLTTHESKADSDDDKADTSPPTSQVQAPAVAPEQPAAPTQPPKKDDDG
jgi:hypothetical protein